MDQDPGGGVSEALRLFPIKDVAYVGVIRDAG